MLKQQTYDSKILERFMTEEEQRKFDEAYWEAKIGWHKRTRGESKKQDNDWAFTCDSCLNFCNADEVNYYQGDPVCNVCMGLENPKTKADVEMLVKFDKFNDAMSKLGDALEDFNDAWRWSKGGDTR